VRGPTRNWGRAARRLPSLARALRDPVPSGWRPSDIERTDVKRLIAELEKRELSPASVLENLAPLRAMSATALDDGLIAANPCAGIRVNRRREESGEHVEAKAMTREQLGRLLEATPDRWLLLFELLAKTGLRISEALVLDWTDVELGSRPTLHVRRQFYRGDLRRLKTHAGRSDLPLSPGLARGRWTARPANGRGPVFATRDGKRLAERNVRRVLDKAGENAGLGWVHFHTFRHTCASILFESDKNICQVCGWLGDTDPTFTLPMYVHLIDAGLGEADVLDNALADALPNSPPTRPSSSSQDDAAASKNPAIAGLS
jgi:integrase